jgi:hypothetical protein
MTTNHLGASVRPDHQFLAVESEHRVHCLLELTAPKAPVAERRPWHLSLVIDRSGSMQATSSRPRRRPPPTSRGAWRPPTGSPS